MVAFGICESLRYCLDASQMVREGGIDCSTCLSFVITGAYGGTKAWRDIEKLV